MYAAVSSRSCPCPSQPADPSASTLELTRWAYCRRRIHPLGMFLGFAGAYFPSSLSSHTHTQIHSLFLFCFFFFVFCFCFCLFLFFAGLCPAPTVECALGHIFSTLLQACVPGSWANRNSTHHSVAFDDVVCTASSATAIRSQASLNSLHYCTTVRGALSFDGWPTAIDNFDCSALWYLQEIQGERIVCCVLCCVCVCVCVCVLCLWLCVLFVRVSFFLLFFKKIIFVITFDSTPTRQLDRGKHKSH